MLDTLTTGTTKTKGRGTGLRLAIVHGIVQGLNGAIKVHSDPGQGTRFQAYHPRLTERFEAPADVAVSLPVGGERIFLVEDEPAVLEMTTEILSVLGYRIECRLPRAGGAPAAVLKYRTKWAMTPSEVSICKWHPPASGRGSAPSPFSHIASRCRRWPHRSGRARDPSRHDGNTMCGWAPVSGEAPPRCDGENPGSHLPCKGASCKPVPTGSHPVRCQSSAGG